MNEEPICYVGIDNGLKGGLTAISGHRKGGVIKTSPMPIEWREGRNQINVIAFDAWMKAFPPHNTYVVIERPCGSKSLKAATSMASSYTALQTVLTLRGYKHTYINARTWQKKMLGIATSVTKEVALVKAIDIWPCEVWLATPRSSVPHDGMIDAALIARYAMLERLDKTHDKRHSENKNTYKLAYSL